MNQYHVYEEISRRRGSTLYKGRLRDTITYCVVKGIDKEYQSLAENEVKMLYNLNHMHILKFLSWYATSRHIWLILEYFTGTSLRVMLQQDNSFPEVFICQYAASICSALHFIHCKGMIYCDLKPSNIVFNDMGVLKLYDFSLARIIETNDKNNSSGRRGSPYYMAPELFQNGGIWSYASDIYSFGCILYEMCCGHPPIVSKDIRDLMQELLKPNPVPSIPNISKEGHNRSEHLIDLIDRCLEKNPYKRITWPEILSHSFWNEHPSHNINIDTTLSLCEQPLFEKSRPVKLQVSEAKIKQMSQMAVHNTQMYATESDEVYIDNEGTAKVTSLDAQLNFSDHISNGNISSDQLPSKSINNQNNQSNNMSTLQNVPETPAGYDLNYIDVNSPFHRSESSYESSLDSKLGSKRSDSSSSLTNTLSNRTTVIHGTEIEPPKTPTRARSAVSRDQNMSNRPNTSMHSNKTHNRNQSGTYMPRPQTSAPSSYPKVDSTLHEQRLLTLAIDASDLMVQPLIDNARIERIPTFEINENLLPFKMYSVDEVFQMNQNEQDEFISLATKFMHSSDNNHEEVATVLTYFQILCRSQKFATKIINSQYQHVLIDLLQSYDSSILKAHMLHIIGLELRYTTSIDPSMAQSNFVQVICDHVMHNDIIVKRWAVAALGELLFYISIESASQTWAVDASTFSLIVNCLKEGEDSVVQHYVMKTIENICAQTGPWCVTFFQQDVACDVLRIYRTTTFSNLKRTSATVLFQLAYRATNTLQYVATQLGGDGLYEGLSSRSVHLQRTFLNLFNIILLNRKCIPREVIKNITTNKQLIARLLKLGESNSVIVRTKLIISISLVGQCDLIWLYRFCHSKCMTLLQRVKTASFNQSLIQVVKVFAEFCVIWIQNILTEMLNIIKRIVNNKYLQTNEIKLMKRIMIKFKLVGQFLLLDVARDHIAKSNIGVLLSQVLQSIVNLKAQDSLQWKQHVLHTTELYTSRCVTENATQILNHILPTLLLLLLNDNAEVRFDSLKILNDTMLRCLQDEEIMNNQQLANILDELIINKLLPQMSKLLIEDMPMPQYCLKVLNALVDLQTKYVIVIHQLLTPQLLQLFAPLKNNNVYNVNLIRHLVLCDDVSLTELCDAGLLNQLIILIDYAFDHQITWYHEPLLDITYQILFTASNELREKSDIIDADEILNRYEILLTIVLHLHHYLDISANYFTEYTQHLSARCLLLLARLYPKRLKLFFIPKQIELVLNVITQVSSEVCVRLLKLLRLYTGSRLFLDLLSNNDDLCTMMAKAMNDVANHSLDSKNNNVNINIAELANEIQQVAMHIKAQNR